MYNISNESRKEEGRKMWPFKGSPGAKDIGDVVADAAKKCRRNQWDNVREIAEELISKYDVTIAARSNFRDERLALEDLEVQAKVDQALGGQKTPNLTSAKKTVEKARTLLRAREEQLQITERRAKQKYPDVFRFL